MKADYLFKFAPFVTWPEQALPEDTTPFTICVAGRDPFGIALEDVVRNQQVRAHPVVVRHMPGLATVAGCHILFLGTGTSPPMPAEVRPVVGHQPILTVTDDGQGPADAAIRFVVRRGRIRFIVNRAAANDARVAISSRLLELAAAVEN